MNKTKTLYWVFTALFSVAMIFTAVPDVMLSADAVTFMKDPLASPITLHFSLALPKYWVR